VIIHAAGLDPEGVEVDFPLERSGPDPGPDEPFLVRTALLSGRVLPWKGGLAFRGRLSGQIELECARCLTSYGLHVEREFDLFYAFAPVKGKEVKIPDDALDYAFLHEGDGIDLEQVAMEQIYLELPMKPLCRTSCRGLCARCGADLNLGECRCEGLSPIS
jgi:uncharacterized metal-binding protein YceD (DUF177 family)